MQVISKFRTIFKINRLIHQQLFINIEFTEHKKWEILYSEDSSTAKLSETLNGRPNLWEDSWIPGRKIRFEWGIQNKFPKCIEFLPESDIFVNRGTTNKIIELKKFVTNVYDPPLQLGSWVERAGGAIFCISKSDGHDSAWGIKDKEDNFFELGCNSGNWDGRGAFYGSNSSSHGFIPGWTGVSNHGEAKAGFNLGLTIKMEHTGKFYVYLMNHWRLL